MPFQCGFPGFSQNWQLIDRVRDLRTECDGCIHKAPYTLSIRYFSHSGFKMSVVGDMEGDRRVLLSDGVPMRLHSVTLNLVSTFSIYCGEERYSFRFCLSWLITRPTKCSAGLHVILYSLWRWWMMVATAVWSSKAKRPSSNHTARMMNAPSVSWVYTHGSALLCLKSSCIRDDWSFWYHSHDDCLGHIVLCEVDIQRFHGKVWHSLRVV
jgi:hypothetical protein